MSKVNVVSMTAETLELDQGVQWIDPFTIQSFSITSTDSKGSKSRYSQSPETIIHRGGPRLNTSVAGVDSKSESGSETRSLEGLHHLLPALCILIRPSHRARDSM